MSWLRLEPACIESSVSSVMSMPALASTHCESLVPA